VTGNGVDEYIREGEMWYDWCGWCVDSRERTVSIQRE
jgi:hypothetical protein